MDVIKKTWTWAWEKSVRGQMRAEAKMKQIGHGRWGRVLRMSRKPTSEEFSKTLIITGIGIVLIGGLGFAIYLIWEYFADFFKWALGL